MGPKISQNYKLLFIQLNTYLNTILTYVTLSFSQFQFFEILLSLENQSFVLNVLELMVQNGYLMEFALSGK